MKFGYEPDCKMCLALYERDRRVVAAAPRLGVLLHDDGVELFGNHIVCQHPAVVDLEQAVQRAARNRQSSSASTAPWPDLVQALQLRLRDASILAASEFGVDCVVGADDIADPRGKNVVDLTAAVAARLSA